MEYLMKQDENLLINQCPELIKEWHPTKNKHLDMYSISYASSKKVWWKCQNSRCGNEWETAVFIRTARYKEHGEITKCKKCRHKPKHGQSFADLYPDKAKEWHPTANSNKLPNDFSYGSNFKAVWLCPECTESYPMIIRNKVYGQSCPYCSGKKVGRFNNLEIMYPDIAKEWHITKNDKKPSEVYAGGDKKYYWICKGYNEEFKTSIYEKLKSNRNSCPFCAGKKVGKRNSLAYLFPSLASEWHPTLNCKEPNEYTAYSRKYAYWQCPIDPSHVYRASIGNRTGNRSGCPHCYHAHTSFWELRVLDALKLCFPEIQHRQTPIPNISKELDIYIPSLKIGIEIDGEKYHKDTMKDIKKNELYKKFGISIIRVRAIGLQPIQPCISNIHPHQPITEYINDLIFLISKLSNKDINPITLNVEKTNQELYREYLESRSLASNYPNISKEYDTVKNELPPELITYGSNRNVFWKGKDCNHEWDAPVVSRTHQGQGCPYCSGKRVNEDNSLASMYPKVSEFWDNDKNKITPNEVTAGSSREVYWLCVKDKSKKCPKKSSIYSRVNTNGCIECFKGSGNHMKGKKYSIPFNKSLESLYPEIAKLWDFENNALTPKDYTPNSSNFVSWLCPSCNKSHSTEIRYKVKSSTKLCKSCASKITKTNNSYNKGKLIPVLYKESLEYLYPFYSKMWDYNKNALTPKQVRGNSSKTVWWICPHCEQSHSAEVRYKVKSKTNGACKNCRNISHSPKEKK
jgi:hypothetical protein